MSAVISISAHRRYGVARVCRVWSIARAGLYRSRRAAVVPPGPRHRPGPQGPMPDAALMDAIRQVLTYSPSTERGIGRSGRGCVTRACAPPASGCAA